MRRAADLALYRTVQGLEKQVCATYSPPWSVLFRPSTLDAGRGAFNFNPRHLPVAFLINRVYKKHGHVTPREGPYCRLTIGCGQTARLPNSGIGLAQAPKRIQLTVGP